MSEAISEKPQCGGGGTNGAEYDLPLHVIGLFLVLGASLFGAGFPVVAKRFKSLKIPPKIFFFCKHFGTGVLIATAFVHLIPTAFQSLNNPCLPDLFTDLYAPLPGVIMMGSMFILFIVEMWLHAKTGGHSHGGSGGSVAMVPTLMPPPPPAAASSPPNYQVYRKRQSRPFYPPAQQFYEEAGDNWEGKNSYDEKGGVKSEMPPWFIVFYEKYVAQQQQILTKIDTFDSKRESISSIAHLKGGNAASTYSYETDIEKADEDAVDPLVLKKLSMQITLIEGGILFHSVFVGMTVSITVDGFIVLLIAILFHQMFEGLGLGSRIAAVPYPKGSWRPWVLVFAFGTTAPIGQAIGLLTRSTYDPDSAFGLIIVGIFNAISSGLLIYAALVDLLAEDFLSEEADLTMTKKDKTMGIIYVLMGAAGMAAVGAFA